MNQDQLKQLVGRAALQYVPAGQVLGVGTGSTVDCFIDALAAEIASGRLAIPGAVSSSERSTQRLRRHGIVVLDAGAVTGLACTSTALTRSTARATWSRAAVPR